MTTVTLDPVNFVAGDFIACVVTPWDGENEGVAVTTPSVKIDDDPPVQMRVQKVWMLYD